MCMNSSVVWPRVSNEVAPKMAGTFWARSRTRAEVLSFGLCRGSGGDCTLDKRRAVCDGGIVVGERA